MSDYDPLVRNCVPSSSVGQAKHSPLLEDYNWQTRWLQVSLTFGVPHSASLKAALTSLRVCVQLLFGVYLLIYHQRLKLLWKRFVNQRKKEVWGLEEYKRYFSGVWSQTDLAAFQQFRLTLVMWVKNTILRGEFFWDVRAGAMGSWIWKKLVQLRSLAK